ncbi:MAG: enoyl-CoA hydratase-related protein, partial [Streptosporangiaceae bacterium]
MSDEVLVERRGAVQVITINRPEARNALNGAVAAGIRDAADELDADGALRVGVLTGAGGTFSSGMDLKAFLKGETPSFPGRGLCGITQTPPRKPLIGAAEGWALAGGFELLLA